MKAELLWLPIVGWKAVLARDIFVHRQTSETFRRLLVTTTRSLKAGNSIMTFPGEQPGGRPWHLASSSCLRFPDANVSLHFAWVCTLYLICSSVAKHVVMAFFYNIARVALLHRGKRSLTGTLSHALNSDSKPGSIKNIVSESAFKDNETVCTLV